MFLLIPENKMTENDHDRSFNLPFQQSKKSLFYDGQNEASIKTKAGHLLRPSPVVYEYLKLSSFKRLKTRLFNRQFDTQNTSKAI